MARWSRNARPTNHQSHPPFGPLYAISGLREIRSMASAQFPDEQSDTGEFERQDDAFRDWVTSDGSSAYPAVAGRYHLYVSWACPWAHRTIIVRHLKQLEKLIGMTVVDPVRDDLGWAFREGPGHTLDPINRFNFLSEAYFATDPHYRGRVTVPVLSPGALNGAIPQGDVYETNFTSGQRNIFRQAWQQRADLSVVKVTKVTERFSVKYSLDVYNLTNHPSFDIPIDNVSQNLGFSPFPSTINTPNAVPSSSACAANGGNPFVSGYFYQCPTGLGQVTKTIGSARQIQMSLKFTF